VTFSFFTFLEGEFGRLEGREGERAHGEQREREAEQHAVHRAVRYEVDGLAAVDESGRAAADDLQSCFGDNSRHKTKTKKSIFRSVVRRFCAFEL
jgi:hypothetical protein